MLRRCSVACVVYLSVAALACTVEVVEDEGAGETAGDSVDDGGDDGGDGGDAGDGSGDAGDGGDSESNPDNPHDDPAQECVDRINMFRATIDLPPLERWVDAEVCSNGQSEDDAATNTPHGAFGACNESAQNECPGWPGPPSAMLEGCLQLMWDEGPGEDFSQHGHYINMSSTQYTKVACGFFETAEGSWWSVQNFK